MVFKLIIDTELEAVNIAKINDLKKWESGNIIKYENKETYKFTGIYISIKNNKVEIKCSLHKLYNKWIQGNLENSGMFTVTEARRTLYTLFNKIGLQPDNARINYFEVGLNIPTDHEPIEYIELIKSITTGKGGKQTKEMFNDANFRKNRQKTTEKRRTIKKYFKIYDKGFEMADRKRTEPNGLKILRIETVYRQQSKNVAQFFEPANIEKIVHGFFLDWSGVEFTKIINADKGIHLSQIQNAEKILLYGRENFLEQTKNDFKAGKLTERAYRTQREFIRDWEDNKHKFRMLPTPHETEYRQKLKELFLIAKC